MLERIGESLDCATFEHPTLGVGLKQIRSECIEAGIWFADHDDVLSDIFASPLAVTCGGATVFTGAAHGKLARTVAVVVNCVARAFDGPAECRVYLIPSAVKRKFPEGGGVVERHHVNGGYCLTGNIPRIVLVREEECVKVAAHEIMHAHVRHTWPTASETLFRRHFHLCDACGDSVAPNEMLVELKAIAFCCALVAVLSGSRRLAARVWEAERAWALAQAARVLHAFKNTQKSSVLEYIVMRGVLMEDTTFEAVMQLDDSDATARSITRRALELSDRVVPEAPPPDASFRFTARVGEDLTRLLSYYIYAP